MPQRLDFYGSEFPKTPERVVRAEEADEAEQIQTTAARPRFDSRSVSTNLN